VDDSLAATTAGAVHGRAHDPDPDHAYGFGLARVLNGLAFVIDGGP
jgi:hypothetical protein